MHVIAEYWFIWLAGLIFSLGVGLFFWYSMFRNTAEKISNEAFERIENNELNFLGVHKSATNLIGMWGKNFVVILMSSFFSIVFFLLLVISIIITVASMASAAIICC